MINTKLLDIYDDNLILSENFIKLTPKEDLNHLFYYYYFYSFIFEAQIDREYTITSIKKLGIDKWDLIKIPDVPIEFQDNVVRLIGEQLRKQEKLKRTIVKERKMIDEIIMCFHQYSVSTK